MSLIIPEALSYDDVLLVPAHSKVIPSKVTVKSRLAGELYLNVPVVSAAMDTITEKDMAIALALEGGVGVIHRNLSPEEQARQVGEVKRHLNWVIRNPITVNPDQSVEDAQQLMFKYKISGLPVVNEKHILKGIITGRDIRFCKDHQQKVQQIMTADPIVVRHDVSTDTVKEKLDYHKIEKLPVVDPDGKLMGLITFRDMEMQEEYPDAALDKDGRLLVGAAISPFDYEVRLPLLQENRVDFVVLDTAHGDSENVVNAVKAIKAMSDVLVVGGNVATAEGTRNLIEAGADAIKIGVGPGSICTTRIVAGIGVPQFTAVVECAEEAARHDIPIIADGGIKYSGDIVKAIGAGASTVMIGNLLAGVKESPGREVLYEGRIFKQYRGMGALGAIKEGSADRYQMDKDAPPVPEGVEGRVPYKGKLKPYLYQLVTGLKKGMGYVGCQTIDELRAYRKFVKITAAGWKESHVHDVSITQEAPNYSKR